MTTTDGKFQSCFPFFGNHAKSADRTSDTSARSVRGMSLNVRCRPSDLIIITVPDSIKQEDRGSFVPVTLHNLPGFVGRGIGCRGDARCTSLLTSTSVPSLRMTRLNATLAVKFVVAIGLSAVTTKLKKLVAPAGSPLVLAPPVTHFVA